MFKHWVNGCDKVFVKIKHSLPRTVNQPVCSLCIVCKGLYKGLWKVYVRVYV